MADALILGAGPAGLQAVFHLGLLGIQAEVIEQGPGPGGQLLRYGDKPVFDMPGFVTTTGDEIATRLYEQGVQMKPVFHFGQKVTGFEPGFVVSCASGLQFQARVLILAGGPKYLGEVAASSMADAELGLYRIGDAARYPGKQPYLIPAFHEAALMAQNVFAVLKGEA